MDPIVMLQVSSALFALAAAGGIVMAVIRFTRGHNPPSSLAMAHGLLAGAGLTLLLYAAFLGGAPGGALLAALLFLLAAAIGVWLNLRYHERRQPLPKSLMLAHAATAVAAFLVLLWVAFA
jgi:hypothetical protein